ncbi:MAG TPA: hypothetical protein VG327_07945 [Mycobacterium sp.]|nr:hypothetical protein [Mycobacterium sp.]
MKAPAKTAITMFGGAAALALSVGFGGVGVSPVGSGSTATTHRSTSMAPAHPDTVAPAGHVGVHTATLTGCIPGANC